MTRLRVSRQRNALRQRMRVAARLADGMALDAAEAVEEEASGVEVAAESEAAIAEMEPSQRMARLLILSRQLLERAALAGDPRAAAYIMGEERRAAARAAAFEPEAEAKEPARTPDDNGRPAVPSETGEPSPYDTHEVASPEQVSRTGTLAAHSRRPAMAPRSMKRAFTRVSPAPAACLPHPVDSCRVPAIRRARPP